MKISIVTPMYNESAVVEIFLRSVIEELQKTQADYEIICINDGSSDDTLLVLKRFKTLYSHLRIINLSRNFGKEAALTAGIEYAVGDVVIPMDADLQDPPVLIHAMLEQYAQGFDVVVARRKTRNTDGFFKKSTASLFYRLIGKLSDIDIPNNVGDFRLMSRRVVDTIKELKETERFMKGIFSWPGFETTVIDYDRMPRVAGKTSFNAWTLWNLAIQGVTSFSVAPLKIGMLMGIFISLVAFIFAIFIVIKTFFYGIDTPGYASIAVLLLFLSGMQFILIGMIGEYVGRIYMEVKNRPVYIVEGEY